MKKNHIKLAWITVLPFIATACKDKQVITPPENNTIQGQFVTSAGSSLVNIIDASIKKIHNYLRIAWGCKHKFTYKETNEHDIVILFCWSNMLAKATNVMFQLCVVFFHGNIHFFHKKVYIVLY